MEFLQERLANQLLAQELRRCPRIVLDELLQEGIDSGRLKAKPFQRQARRLLRPLLIARFWSSRQRTGKSSLNLGLVFWIRGGCSFLSFLPFFLLPFLSFSFFLFFSLLCCRLFQRFVKLCEFLVF